MTGIFIRRPVEDVFDFVMAIEQTPRWRPRMSQVAWTSEGPPGLGSRFEVTVKVVGIRYHFRFEVVTWVPPFAATFRQASAVGKTDSLMEWRPEEDGCRFRIGATYETATWFKPMVPFVAASVLRQNLDDLVRLKRLLEDGA